MGCGTSNEVNRKEFDLGKESRKSALGKDTCRARWHLKDGRGGRQIVTVRKSNVICY